MKIIIQARTGSVRLPNKVLLDFFENQSILDIVIKTCKSSKYKPDVILATSINDSDGVLRGFAERHQIDFFQGHEEDVLDRFICCAEKFGAKNVVRVCADNPFLLVDNLDELIALAEVETFDYASYQNEQGIPAIKTHFGLFSEVVSLKALKKVENMTKSIAYREHVTNFIYTHEEQFSIKFLPFDDLIKARNDIRLTCDTIDDFNMLQLLYLDYLQKYESEQVKLQNLIHLIDAKPDYKQVMQNSINKIIK